MGPFSVRAKNACLLKYKSKLVMTPGNLFHKGQPRPTSSSWHVSGYSRKTRKVSRERHDTNLHSKKHKSLRFVDLRSGRAGVVKVSEIFQPNSVSTNNQDWGMNRNAEEQFVRSGQRPFWKVPFTFWFFFCQKSTYHTIICMLTTAVIGVDQ